MRRIVFAWIVVLLLSCPAHAGDLERLVEWMTGSFSSEAQAAAGKQVWGAENGPYVFVRVTRDRESVPE
jgi:hypothetical protein